MLFDDIQKVLRRERFYTGILDGRPGPKMDEAVSEFKRSNGLLPRPYIGPLTLRSLGIAPERLAEMPTPWMNNMSRYSGLHEAKNFKRLYQWLRSDGQTLGDPRKFPWCGDAVHTAMSLALPNELFSGKVGRNPYLARNWLDFGEKTDVAYYGAVCVFWRGKRTGVSGHVGFVAGIDTNRQRILVRGGNQSNRVSDAWLSSDRLLGYRLPITYVGPWEKALNLNSKKALVSVNEY